MKFRPSDAVHVREDIPIAGKDQEGDIQTHNVGMERQVEDDGIQTTPVERSRRVGLLGMQSKRVAVDKPFGDVGVVLPRLDLAEVLAFHGRKALQVVDAQADLNDGIGVDRHDVAEIVHTVGRNQRIVRAVRSVHEHVKRAFGLGLQGNGRRVGCGGPTAALRGADARVIEPPVGGLVGLEPARKDELHDGVVEQQLHLHRGAIAVRLGAVLHGVDQLVKQTFGKAVALADVQVDVLGLDARLQIRLGDLAAGRGAVLVGLVHHNIRVRHND